MRLVVGTVLLGQVFPSLIRFFLATTISPVFHVHFHQTKHWSARQEDEATGNLKLRQHSTVKRGQWKQKQLMNVSPNMVGLKCKILQSSPVCRRNVKKVLLCNSAYLIFCTFVNRDCNPCWCQFPASRPRFYRNLQFSCRPSKVD